MKNKRGFTLVEVLCVIIIITVILSIAVPIVFKHIDTSRDEIDDESFSMYIKSVNSAILSKRLEGDVVKDGEYIINSDGNICINSNCIILHLEKSHPTSGTIIIENEEIKSYNIDGRRSE